MEAAKLKKGSSESNRSKVGKVTTKYAQLQKTRCLI